MPYKDKTEQAKASHAHYEANKEAVRVRTKNAREERYRAIRKIIRDTKDVPCIDCEMRYPYYVMQFDHVRGKKLFNVSYNGQWSSVQKVVDEIAKCDVVCANCHAERTFGGEDSVLVDI